MTINAQVFRKKILSLQKRRKKLFQKLGSLDTMIRGSITQLGTMCQRKECECHRGKRHGTAYYLSTSVNGKTQMLYLHKDQVPGVSEGINDYEHFKHLGQDICRLNAEILMFEKKMKKEFNKNQEGRKS